MQIKKILTTLFLIAITTQVKIETSKITLYPSAPLQPSADYSKCYKILLSIGVEIVALVKDATSKNIPDLIMQAIALIKNLYEDIKCFTNPSNLVMIFKDAFSHFMTLKGDRKECFISHLNSAYDHLKTGVMDLLEFNLSGFETEFQNVINVLQEAVDQC